MKDWIPPHSTYDLLQERYWPDEWKVLVVCLLLNQTSRKQVEPIIQFFFKKYPTPESIIRCELNSLIGDIKHLGLSNRRAVTLKRFSLDFLAREEGTNILDLYGCGKYASDAYRLFFGGDWYNVKPNDHALNDYHNFLRKKFRKFNIIKEEVLTDADL